MSGCCHAASAIPPPCVAVRLAGCIHPLPWARRLSVVLMSAWIWPLVLGPSAAIGQSEPEFIGRASCAASTCHGGVIERGPPWRYALSRWVAEDPHAGAGLALLGELSESIVMALDPKIEQLKAAEESADSGQPTEWMARRDAVLRQRCLSCHVTVTAAQCTGNQPLSASFLARGVSCESCHGAAGSWIDRHLALDFDDSAKTESGMRDTESIVGRASGCVRCHVGSRSEDGLVRDMNHDLIAAGHPVLRFDLSLFDAALPAHWQRSADDPFYESPLRVRQAGRSMSLSAAAKLAGERADAYLVALNAAENEEFTTVPMPEFSDYDCFACHQSLTMDQYRLPATRPGPPLQVSAGLPIWNSWHSIGQLKLEEDKLRILAPTVIDQSRADRLSQIGKGIAALYRNQAAELADSELDSLAVIQTILAERIQPGDDWHQAAINFLDLEAALRDLQASDPKYAALRERLITEVQVLLRFDRDLHSPADFDLDASGEYADKVKAIFAGQL